MFYRDQTFDLFSAEIITATSVSRMATPRSLGPVSRSWLNIWNKSLHSAIFNFTLCYAQNRPILMTVTRNAN